MSNIPISTLLGSCVQLTSQKRLLDGTYVSLLSTCIQKAHLELKEAGITGVVFSCLHCRQARDNLALRICRKVIASGGHGN